MSLTAAVYTGGMSKKAEQTPQTDDIELFRQTVGEVRPVRAPTRVMPAKQRRFNLRARHEERDAVLAESLHLPADSTEMETGEELLYRRPRVSQKAFRRLRRGQYPVNDELDLHCMTLSTANIALADFIDECIEHENRCVRIIHGKGLRSSNRGPVLKGFVNQWLRRHPAVVAFCTTPLHDGGTGAVYVLLG